MSSATIKIGERRIGPEQPVFVIAEIGVNHDGDVHKATELVRIAAACGADAVKLQVFKAMSLMHPSAEMATYQQERVAESDAASMLRRFEFQRADLRAIVRSIVDANLLPLATPFSPSDVDTLASLQLPAVKIASPDLINRLLLQQVLQLGKPMLLSTGAATFEEVTQTVDWLRRQNASFSLLHCVSSYPCASQHANLNWIKQLATFGIPVGYSDHTIHPMSGALAVAAGACIIEKHLTYDRTARGPDHSASADPQQFERYVRHIREAETLRGSGGRRVLDCEHDVRRVSRQSFVLRRSLEAGDRIGASDLTVQRPGTGISAVRLEDVIGRRLAKPLSAGTMLKPDMLTDWTERAA